LYVCMFVHTSRQKVNLQHDNTLDGVAGHGHYGDILRGHFTWANSWPMPCPYFDAPCELLPTSVKSC
jgi:hypothetical protein